MKLIRSTGVRVAKIGRYRRIEMGLYWCQECGNEVELPVSVGRNHGSCGCQERSIRREIIYTPKPAERSCLMCGKWFMSRGPHNRRCGLCETAVSGGGQAYYMPLVHKQREHSVVAECSEV